MQAGIAGFRNLIELLDCGLRVVAQRLHAVTHFRPEFLQLGPRFGEQRPGIAYQANLILAIGRADPERQQSCLAQPCQHLVAISLAHLDHRAKFFGKQRGQHPVLIAAVQQRRLALLAVHVVRLGVAGKQIQVQRHAGMRGESHLANCREQSAVGAVVIRE